jgi:CheY-like chemotaxis protein
MSRILIVEDNDDNYLLISEILSDYAITLVRAANGKEFFSIISQSKNFDLVLMDLLLPDYDGIELTKHLINNNIHIPIVFISAYTQRCEEIFELGVDYFLEKPVMCELFLSVVSKYVELKDKDIA